MIEALMGLLITFSVLAVFFWIAKLAAKHFEIPYVFVQIVGVIFALIFLLALLSALGYHGRWPRL